jgi:hypothetical protein
MRVCQFRHDGKWTVNCGSGTPPHQEDLPSYSTGAKLPVKRLANPVVDLLCWNLQDYFRVLVAFTKLAQDEREPISHQS